MKTEFGVLESVAKGLSDTQQRYVRGIVARTGITDQDARVELEAELWDFESALVNVENEMDSDFGYVSNWPGQPLDAQGNSTIKNY